MEKENKDMDEILAKLEELFADKGYTIDNLREALNHTGELTIIVNQIKAQIMSENPSISHEELIAEASDRVAEMVRENERSQQEGRNISDDEGQK
jgi:hypothetical protein